MKKNNFQSELKVCFEAAQAASKVILRYHEKSFSIRKKGEINLVTEVDEKAQKAIVKVIHQKFKKDAILAEEGDLSKTAASPRRWIVDPIDGTTNFAHGYPMFCVSIAFEQEGETRCGIILAPYLKETFHAVREGGTFLNKKRIQISDQKILRDSLLVTGFPYDLENPAFNNVPYFLHLLKKAQAIRRDGSAALNLAYVACGRFDGFWELGLSPWDVAAGFLLIEEAGGQIKNFAGRPAKIENHSIVAGNSFIVSQLLQEIQLA